jgi:hypothetical protein
MLYRYTASDERVYPFLSTDGRVHPVTARPGMEPIELDEMPNDGHWEPVRSAPKKTAAKAAEESA